MSLKHRLLSTSALNLVDFAIKIIVVFLVSPFLIHRLGKPEYGLWMLLLSILGYLDLLDLGFNQTSVRCLSQALATQDPNRTAAVFQHFRRIYRRAAFAALLLTITAVFFLPFWVDNPDVLHKSRLVLGVGGLLTSLSYFLRVHTSLLKSHILYHKLILAGMARLLVNTTLIVAFLLAGHGLEALALAWAIGLIVEQSLIWLQARPLVPTPQPQLHLPPSEQKEIRGFAAKMTLWSMASFMRERVDTQVLGSNLGSIAVAHYAVGSRLVTLFSDLVNAVFGSHLLAAFSQLNEQHGSSGAAARLLSSLRLSAPFALCGGISLFLLGPAFVDRWLGPGFEQSHLVIQILSFPLSITLMQYPTGAFLGAQNRHGMLALVSVIGGALNLIGSLLLVHWIGFEGVVIATAIELLLTGLVAWPWIVTRHRTVTLKQYLPLIAKPIAVLSPVALIGIFLQSFWGLPTSYPTLFAAGTALAIVLATIVWTVLLTSAERSWIISKRPQTPNSIASRHQPMLTPVRAVASTCKRFITRIRRTPTQKPLQPPVNAALQTLASTPNFIVVQLGAYIGNSDNDPLFHFLSRQPITHPPSHQAILVEPVTAFFSQLQHNYRQVPGVTLENLAISNHSGTAPFYRLGVDPVAHGFPEWLSQLSSLKNERMLELWEQYEADPAIQAFYLKHRITEEVPCITFDQLAQKHALHQVDLLQMDVEGYEFEILKTIDFKRWNIRFINYESVLLQNNKTACESLLRDHGYLLASYQKDTFACRPEDAHLLRSIGHSPT